MAVPALRLLQQLTPRFSRPASAQEVFETYRLARQLFDIPEDSLPDKQAGQRLREKVAKAVLGLAAALSMLADKHGSGGAAVAAAAAASWPQPSHAQLLAASLALVQCTRLGMRMAVSADGAARIAAAAHLVLRASPHALAAGRARLADSRPMIAVGLCYYCSGYATALHAVCELLAAAPGYQQAAAAFASSTARPEVLLPFLREVAQTLLALPTKDEDDRESAPQAQRALAVLSDTLNTLLVQPIWSQHAAAIPSDAALQQALAELLLTRSLPALAAEAATLGAAADADSLASIDRQVTWMARALRSAPLAPAAAQHLRQPGCWLPAVTAAVSILQALPEQRPAGDARHQFASAWAVGVQLLTEVVKFADGQPPSPPESIASSGAAPSSREWRQAAAAVLGALPRLAAALLSAVGNGNVPNAEEELEHLRCLSGWCGNLSFMLKLIFARVGAAPPAGDSDVAIWLQAAAAGLRVQPLLVQLDPAFRQLPDTATHQAAHWLSTHLLHTVELALPGLPGQAQLAAAASGRNAASGAVGGGGTARGSAGEAALAADCAALHTQLCRLAHYLAGGAAMLADAPWHWLLPGLHTTCVAALQPYLGALGAATDPAAATVRTLCATHWAALEASIEAAADAAAEAASDAAGPSKCTAAHQEAAESVVASLLLVAEALPFLVGADFLRPAHTVLEPLAQDGSRLAAMGSLLRTLAEPAGADSHLACAFACAGLLHMAAECALLLSASGPSGAEQAAALLDPCTVIIGHLAAAGSRIADGTAGGGMPIQLQEMASGSAEELLAQTLAMATKASAPVAQRAQQLQDTLPAVEQVAAPVELREMLNELVQARQMALARAAAGRSCAYLHCSNLQRGGSSRIVAGVKGLRCSACRAVWYCGTACSHADWRQGGHRRVCKLLGEERQAAKAARQGAAEAAEAAAAGVKGAPLQDA